MKFEEWWEAPRDLWWKNMFESKDPWEGIGFLEKVKWKLFKTDQELEDMIEQRKQKEITEAKALLEQHPEWLTDPYEDYAGCIHHWGDYPVTILTYAYWEHERSILEGTGKATPDKIAQCERERDKYLVYHVRRYLKRLEEQKADPVGFEQKEKERRVQIKGYIRNYTLQNMYVYDPSRKRPVAPPDHPDAIPYDLIKLAIEYGLTDEDILNGVMPPQEVILDYAWKRQKCGQSVLTYNDEEVVPTGAYKDRNGKVHLFEGNFTYNSRNTPPASFSRTSAGTVCPICGSTATERISPVTRAVSMEMYGHHSTTIGRSWHCRACGSDF